MCYKMLHQLQRILDTLLPHVSFYVCIKTITIHIESPCFSAVMLYDETPVCQIMFVFRSTTHFKKKKKIMSILFSVLCYTIWKPKISFLSRFSSLAVAFMIPPLFSIREFVIYLRQRYGKLLLFFL